MTTMTMTTMMTTMMMMIVVVRLVEIFQLDVEEKKLDFSCYLLLLLLFQEIILPNLCKY